MHLSHEDEDEDNNFSLKKFESMLRTNKVLFFDSEEFTDIIIYYIDTGKLAMARKALKLAFAQHPNSVSLKLVQVELLVYENKLDIADKILEEIILLEPQNEDIYIQKANVLSKRDQHENAIKQLRIALDLTENKADVSGMIGMEYLFMDDLAAAKTAFAACLEHDPEDQMALYHVVYCYDLLDDLDGAVTYLNELINKSPYNEVAWNHLGIILSRSKKHEEALVAFNYATLIDDEFLGAQIEKGKCLEKLKKYEEAIESYLITLPLDEPNSFVFLRLGRCYEKINNYTEAAKFYEKTVHEDPLLDKGWIAAAKFYFKQNDFTKALNHIKKALEIDNENTKYWKKYALIKNKFNDFQEVELGYRKAIEYGDKKISTWILWVDSLCKIKDYECAEASLLLAANSFPDDAVIEYRLAGIYFCHLNKIELGSFHLHNALRIDYYQRNILLELFPKIIEIDLAQKIISQY